MFVLAPPSVILCRRIVVGVDEVSGLGDLDVLGPSRVCGGVAAGTDLELSAPRPLLRSGKGMKP